jgi:hypothetical protein
MSSTILLLFVLLAAFVGYLLGWRDCDAARERERQHREVEE